MLLQASLKWKKETVVQYSKPANSNFNDILLNRNNTILAEGVFDIL